MASNEGNLQASASALDELTSMAGKHPIDPQDHFHAPSDQGKSHAFLSKFFPSQEHLQSLETRFHMGNYVIDRRTGKKDFEAMSIYVRVGMHLLYYGRAQERVLHAQKVEKLLQEQSIKMGKQYDDPASVDHIQPFIDSFQLGPTMSEMVQPDPRQYRTFNEFFAREIREDARPIDEPGNDLVTSSPADCRLTTFPSIDAATQIWIKGQGFTLSSLFASDVVGREFEGGAIAIARLAPQDYHRWHSPVSGVVEAVQEIPGTYYTVNVSSTLPALDDNWVPLTTFQPQAINEPGIVDVFCQNRRSVMIVRRAATNSRIAIVAVGAMLVGSIKYQPGLTQPGAQIHRGQCLGAFYYGGSTIIVVYPPGEVNFDSDLVRNSTQEKCETLVKVGWRIGASNH